MLFRVNAAAVSVRWRDIVLWLDDYVGVGNWQWIYVDSEADPAYKLIMLEDSPIATLAAVKWSS